LVAFVTFCPSSGAALAARELVLDVVDDLLDRAAMDFAALDETRFG
jgi:hypothetical protein